MASKPTAALLSLLLCFLAHGTEALVDSPVSTTAYAESGIILSLDIQQGNNSRLISYHGDDSSKNFPATLHPWVPLPQLQSLASKDGVIIITSGNLAYLPFVHNWWLALQHVGAVNTLVVSEDEQVGDEPSSCCIFITRPNLLSGGCGAAASATGAVFFLLVVRMHIALCVANKLDDLHRTRVWPLCGHVSESVRLAVKRVSLCPWPTAVCTIDMLSWHVVCYNRS